MLEKKKHLVFLAFLAKRFYWLVAQTEVNNSCILLACVKAALPERKKPERSCALSHFFLLGKEAVTQASVVYGQGQKANKNVQ